MVGCDHCTGLKVSAVVVSGAKAIAPSPGGLPGSGLVGAAFADAAAVDFGPYSGVVVRRLARAVAAAVVAAVASDAPSLRCSFATADPAGAGVVVVVVVGAGAGADVVVVVVGAAAGAVVVVVGGGAAAAEDGAAAVVAAAVVEPEAQPRVGD